MSIENIEIDQIDRLIIDLLQGDASLTSAEIAKQVDLSPSAVNERMRKLRTNGVISKISAFIKAAAVQKTLCVFMYVLVETPAQSKNFLKKIENNENIMECHHMAGEYSYLLKVRVKDTLALEDFITNFLKSIPGVTRTMTQLVLSSPKDGDTIID